MSTIALKGNTLSCSIGFGSFSAIGSSFNTAKRNTASLTSRLGTLKNKVSAVNAVVNVGCSNDKVYKAQQREENKKTSLSLAYDKLEKFIRDVSKVDSTVKRKIEERKEAFYKKYQYLKPKCERTRWEKFKDAVSTGAKFVKDVFVAVGTWCKEHWVELLVGIALIVVGALITVFTAGVGTAFWAAFGAALLKGVTMAVTAGAVAGSISGGISAATTIATGLREGKSFNGELLSNAFNSFITSFGDEFASGFMTGGISFFGASIGTAVSVGTKAVTISCDTFKKISKIVLAMDVIDKVWGVYDNGCMLLNMVFPDCKLNNWLVKLNSNPAYNFVKNGFDYIKEFTDAFSGKLAVNDGSHMNKNGNLEPDVRYVAGENKYIYETDSKGRLESAYAENLKLKQHEGRLRHDKDTPGKLKYDDAGHILGDAFGGSPYKDNLTSQASKINRSGGEYYKIEQEMYKALKNEKKVTDVKIKINYDGNSIRPSDYKVKYKIDGKKFNPDAIKNINVNSTQNKGGKE